LRTSIRTEIGSELTGYLQDECSCRHTEYTEADDVEEEEEEEE